MQVVSSEYKFYCFRIKSEYPQKYLSISFYVENYINKRKYYDLYLKLN